MPARRRSISKPKPSFVFTGARNVLPERRALVAQLVEQRFCNSLDQSAKVLESLIVFQNRVSGVYVGVMCRLSSAGRAVVL